MKACRDKRYLALTDGSFTHHNYTYIIRSQLAILSRTHLTTNLSCGPAELASYIITIQGLLYIADANYCHAGLAIASDRHYLIPYTYLQGLTIAVDHIPIFLYFGLSFGPRNCEPQELELAADGPKTVPTGDDSRKTQNCISMAWTT